MSPTTTSTAGGVSHQVELVEEVPPGKPEGGPLVWGAAKVGLAAVELVEDLPAGDISWDVGDVLSVGVVHYK